MKTHVIILAQGNQSRLPKLTCSKQMLPLPACGDTPILYRTLRQLVQVGYANSDCTVTVVTWFPLMEHLQLYPVVVPLIRNELALTEILYHPNVDTLSDPGNSSLKGVSRYIEKHLNLLRHFEQTVVLLGDVVYSWDCLRAIFAGENGSDMGFIGTSDLSTNGGELWGLMWTRSTSKLIFRALVDALEKHPPFAEYQPGQLRRWLWAVDAIMNPPQDGGQSQQIPRTWFRAIDDYTRDIDLPEHVAMLSDLSILAAVDDANNGVTW